MILIDFLIAIYFKDDFARLITPFQSFQTGKCLSFWYSMFGKDIGSLNVYSQTRANTSTDLLIVDQQTRIWSLSRNQMEKWHLARVPTNYRSDFRVIFEGVVGVSGKGDIVIEILLFNITSILFFNQL